MKDKSRFMSSVIVSLLAGFIYYLVGQDISENVQSSIKAIISSNDINETEEQYMPTDCLPFTSVVEKSGLKSKQKKTKFYIKKRNTIEFKNKDVTIPGEELISAYVSNQAKFEKPTADKNSDFTAELNQLIENSGSEVKPVKELSKLLSKYKQEVADSRDYKRKTEELSKNFEQTQIISYKYRKGNAEYKGSGFEYNYVTGEATPEAMSNSGEVYSTAPESDCKNYKVKYKRTNKIKYERNTAPEVHININDEDTDCELQEINSDESCDEDSM